MYNSHEERAMIQAATRNEDVPGVVVGVGLRDPGENRCANDSAAKHNIRKPFAIYVGRIDENKGCKELFDFFLRYAATFPRVSILCLIGCAIMPIPQHPRIHHLGFLPDEDKFDGIAASDLLIMPSYFESLSMVALEAWALGRPVLANGRCDVLKGQCIRSGAGLYYERYEEFAETLYALESNGPLHARLGRNGRDYFTEHYTWPVIERKYLDMFDRLKRDEADRIGARTARVAAGGWFADGDAIDRRPASEVLAGIPAGAATNGQLPATSPDPHECRAPAARPRASGPGHARLRRCHRP